MSILPPSVAPFPSGTCIPPPPFPPEVDSSRPQVVPPPCNLFSPLPRAKAGPGLFIRENAHPFRPAWISLQASSLDLVTLVTEPVSDKLQFSHVLRSAEASHTQAHWRTAVEERPKLLRLAGSCLSPWMRILVASVLQEAEPLGGRGGWFKVTR